MEKRRVLIVDDHQAVRFGIRGIVESASPSYVVTEAKNGQEAVQWAETHRLDIAIVDMSMPVMNGVETAKRLCAVAPDARIIGLSLYADASLVRAMLATGAMAFLFKSGDFDESLCAALAACVKGERYIAPEVKEVLEEARAQGTRSQHFDPTVLGSREREALRLLVEGLSHKEIAARMCVSVDTAKTHLRNIRRKTGRHKTAELIKFAHHTGLTCR